MGTFVEALAVKLEEAMPGGGPGASGGASGMFGPKLVRRITVDAGSERLELRRAGDGFETQLLAPLGRDRAQERDGRHRHVAAAHSGQALAEQAQRSQTTRQALERLLNE